MKALPLQSKLKRSFIILIGGQNYRMPDKMTG